MAASKFNDDTLGIGGITFKKMKNGNLFIGFKAEPEIFGQEEH
jgi:hypothetical protein